MDDKRQKLLIRSFQAQDQAEASALIQVNLGARFGHLDPTRNPDLTDIMATYVVPGHPVLVATYQSQIVGTGILFLQSSTTGELLRISTHPDYQRRGIATTLCQHLLADARQRGLRRIHLETNSDWTDALRLYQSLDFRIYRQTTENVFLERYL